MDVLRRSSRRFFKEILVLAALVLLLAYAARQLEGIDAGKMETDVPSFSELFEGLFTESPTAPGGSDGADSNSADSKTTDTKTGDTAEK